eukprot:gene54073-62188_t
MAAGRGRRPTATRCSVYSTPLPLPSVSYDTDLGELRQERLAAAQEELAASRRQGRRSPRAQDPPAPRRPSPTQEENAMRRASALDAQQAQAGKDREQAGLVSTQRALLATKERSVDELQRQIAELGDRLSGREEVGMLQEQLIREKQEKLDNFAALTEELRAQPVGGGGVSGSSARASRRSSPISSRDRSPNTRRADDRSSAQQQQQGSTVDGGAPRSRSARRDGGYEGMSADGAAQRSSSTRPDSPGRREWGDAADRYGDPIHARSD